jgi:hypothetical protein
LRPRRTRHTAKDPHPHLALDLGATKEEIDAVLQLTSVLGIHTMSLGAPNLLEELAAREVAK